MYEVKISSPDLDRAIPEVADLRPRLTASQRSGLSSAGYYVMEELRDFLRTSGHGSFSPAHPLSREYEKVNGRWRRRSEYNGPYSGMAKFARYRVNKDADEADFGFGTFSARDVRRGRVLAYKRDFQKVMRRAQRQHNIRVSRDMRRMFGATRKSREDTPGQDFFPLRNETRTLSVAARPIDVPLYRRVKDKAEKQFDEALNRAWTKRTKKF